jgi:hypothetical protein
MAAPMPKENGNKEKINNLLSQLETEFRWCAQHPNDVSDIQLEQLEQAVDELEERCKLLGGKFYSDFETFRKKFDYMAEHPNKIKLGDYQKFDEMIQQLFRDLK